MTRQSGCGLSKGWLGAIVLMAGVALFAAVRASAQDTTGATTQLGQQPVLSQQQAYCQQLERQLGKDWQQGANARDQLPKIEAQMARTDQLYQRAQSSAEQADCFDYFLFTKSWRDTGQCRQIRQQIEGAQQTLADLDRQRKSAGAAQEHNSGQDALVTELARSHCGQQYETALQRRPEGALPGFWNDSEGQAGDGGIFPNFGSPAPGAGGSTYRTICVRMCDGYYFPINFATTQESFPGDEQTCQRQCGTPARLYYYPNPGGEVQQAMALDGTPYTSLRNAFRYRKELVKSCTCRSPADGVEATADTEPLQPGDSWAPVSGAQTGVGPDQQSGPLPPVEFGPATLFPDAPALPVKKPRKAAQSPLGITTSRQ